MSFEAEPAQGLSPLKQALVAIKDLQAQLQTAKAGHTEPIAIVGMGCRYPGAAGLTEFWRLLRDGIDAISDAPTSRWDADTLYDSDPAAPAKMVSRKGGFLDRLDEFDAAFFGISPREAPFVDPRQRLILEAAWEALEDAGIPADRLAGSPTGVFVATLTNDYDHLLFNDLRRAEAYAGAGTANSVVANRISYFLDLHGPSMALDTACSGSLVAVHLACESLRRGDSSLALAGGVNANLMPKSNVFFSKAGALSPNGRCKTFDRDADGMIRSDGAGIVVLKRLSDAVRDGDRVWAVVQGSAVNHDGRSNGIMAPNGEAQRALLEEAYRRAAVSPSDVQFVEAHGTGTKLGDPIEVHALGAVLSTDRAADRPCVLGSVKTNIGHTEAAAGVAGIIKTALALRHGQIPATLHFENPNPLIALDESPFVVRNTLGPWPCETVRRIAAVSGFGFGGTNAHVVLAEAPQRSHEPAARASPYLLTLSARTSQGLRDLAGAYHSLLADETVDPDDACFSAAVRRIHHGHRAAFAANNREILLEKLAEFAAAEITPDASEAGDGAPVDGARVAFLFSGQGSHWVGMGRELSQRYPVFRGVLEQCDRLFSKHAPWSLLEELAKQEAESQLNDTAITQPAIFAVQVALAELYRSWGITPSSVVGHSLGEVAAAHVAGALRLEDAVRIVFHRSRLMKTVAGKGKTAVVGLPIDEARAAIADFDATLAVAGTNSPTTSVLSGDPATLDGVLAGLNARDIFCRPLQGVNIAFHSPQMDPLRTELVAALDGIQPQRATVPILSAVTAGFVEGHELDAEYWGRNLREPFLFAQATERLFAEGYTSVVEVSPHPVLCSALSQSARHHDRPTVRALGSLRRNESELAAIFATVGTLYQQGAAIAWQGVYPAGGRVISLPPYPWQRQRYWFDQIVEGEAPPAAKAVGLHPLLGERVEPASLPGIAAEHHRHFLWETDCSEQQPRYLADHRVRGSAVFPGTGYLEMAIAGAAQVLPGSRAAVRDVRFERALTLEGGSSRRLQLVLSGTGEHWEFHLYSRPSGEASANQEIGQGITATWTLHASGRIETTEEPVRRVDLDQIRRRCVADVSPEFHYAAMRSNGLAYGPAFRGLTEIRQGNGEALARITLSPQVSNQGYVVHPAVLDAAFQLVAAVPPQGAPASASLYQHSYLPGAVKSWQVFQPVQDSAWCHATLRGKPGDERIEADLELLDATGQILARVEALTLKRTAELQRVPLAESLIEERWEPRPLLPRDHGPAQARQGGDPDPVSTDIYSAPHRNGDGRASEDRAAFQPRWILCADRGGISDDLARGLRQQGCVVTLAYAGSAFGQIDDTAFEVRPDHPEDFARLLETAGSECHGVVHLWSLDAPVANDEQDGLADSPLLGCGGALHVAQAAARFARGTRLWFVTRGAQAINEERVNVQQAALSGLTRVIAQEHPELRCCQVDLDAASAKDTALALLDECTAGDSEILVAWRDGVRYAARLVHSTLFTDQHDTATAVAPALSADACYLITGGLGALGLQTAKELVLHGARHLVLTGRSGAAGKQHSVQELEKLGARVIVAKVDVSDGRQLEALFRETLSGLPPLRGVIHAAGVLDDGMLLQQSAERFRNVMAPKVQGAWNLHLLTRNLPLDFFVCFSSAASLVGSPGQSNYAAGNAFLDALASHRKSLGLPALSINWGAWNDQGMATDEQARKRMETHGVSGIDPADGLSLLSLLLRRGLPVARLGVLPVDWPRFLAQFPRGVPALFEMLAAGITVEPKQTFADLLAETPTNERGSLLRRHLREQLASVLRFDSPSSISVRDRFFDLGMDSLTALELKNRLEAELAVELPATLAFDYPTLEALEQHLAPSIETRAMEPPLEAAIEDHSELDSLSNEELARLLEQELREGEVHVH